MALPYNYHQSSVPFGTGILTTSSVQQISQIYQQHNIHTMAFLQGMQYPQPHVGYNFIPIPFKPYYTPPVSNNFLRPHSTLDSLPFSANAAVQKMTYPIAPMALRPIPIDASTQTYQAQLRQVVKRVAASDARVDAESKRLKPTVESSPLNFKRNKSALANSRPLDLIVIPDDDEPTTIRGSIPLSGSRINPHFVGQNGGAAVENDVSLNVDPTYQQQLLLKPGPGQQYITKIRTLVEGIPSSVGDTKLGPSSAENPAKDNKIRQKSKTTGNRSKKKRKVSESIETEPSIIPNNWHPEPESYANDHLVIGSNGTFISKSFYNRIPWKSFNKSTRILIGHYFNNYTLATQSLDGDNPLNGSVIEDITNHVMVKCNVGKDSVRNIISSICADEAARRRRC